MATYSPQPAPDLKPVYVGVWSRLRYLRAAPSTTPVNRGRHFALTVLTHVENKVPYYRYDRVVDLSGTDTWTHEDNVLPPDDGPNNNPLRPSRYYMDGLIRLGEVDWNNYFGWWQRVDYPDGRSERVFRPGVLHGLPSKPDPKVLFWSEAQWIGYAIREISGSEDVFHALPDPDAPEDPDAREATRPGHIALCAGDDEELDQFRLRLESYGAEIAEKMKTEGAGPHNEINFDWSFL